VLASVEGKEKKKRGPGRPRKHPLPPAVNPLKPKPQLPLQKKQKFKPKWSRLHKTVKNKVKAKVKPNGSLGENLSVGTDIVVQSLSTVWPLS